MVDRVYEKIKCICGRGTRFPPITPLPDHLGWVQQRRLDFFRDTMGYLSNNRLHGVYAEFGCHTAMTFRYALNTIGDRRQTASRLHRFYAFDSFQGLPPPSGIDQQEVWKEGTLSTSQPAFMDACRRDLYRITVVPGFFPKVFRPLHGLNRIEL